MDGHTETTGTRTCSRRGFLQGLVATGASVVTARWIAGGGAAIGVGALSGGAAAEGPFSRALYLPPVLTESDITLVAAETEVAVLPGAPTRMWTFNGSFPGPVIRRPSGQTTRVTVQHRLPADAGTLTIHHHGAHAAPAEDGQPGRNVIEPGSERTYVYDLVEDGGAERAATQWYHDHTHYKTSRNTWRGLVGLFLVDDDVDAALPLPSGEHDLPLVLAERSFGSDNQLLDPFVDYEDAPAPTSGSLQGYAPFDDVFGSHVLVNGVPQPHVEVAARRYRLRILNSSHYRPYNLALTDGSAFVQIGTESGLLPAPITVTSCVLGPAERAELVVDFSALAGQTVRLASVPFVDDDGLPKTPAAVLREGFLEFRVTRTAEDDSSVPDTLRPLPDWASALPVVPDRVWAFGLGADDKGRTAWTVNGRAFDHGRVDAKPELDSTETWAFVNTSAEGHSHYIHIHDVDWRVVSRNGLPPSADSPENGLKETFRLDPGEVLLVGSKFTDHLGPYMVHCHMLVHEDHGMMTTWEVVAPGQGDSVQGQGLDAVLARDVASPAVRAQVAAVMAAAQDGRAAPATVLLQAQLDALARCAVETGGNALTRNPHAALPAAHLHP